MFASVDRTPVDMQESRARERLQRAVGAGYRVGGLLGRGGFAEVFEAQDLQLARRVAIKIMRSDLGDTEEVRQRFQQEARAMANLRHPNVMEVYAVGEGEGVVYFVMPFVMGESLKTRIEREGPLPIPEARRILVDAAGAIAAAHRAGTVHRDVKPDNILLEGEDRRVLITDFGIAKALEADTSTITRSGAIVGTPSYMSPEQATGERVDHRSDIYSLGLVAFEMMAGRPPFVAKSAQALITQHLTQAPPPLRSLRPDCPELLAEVVERCLEKDPGERWATLEQMVEALEGRVELGSFGRMVGLSAKPEESNRASIEAASPLIAFRRRAIAIAAAGLLLGAVDLAVGLGGISAWLAAMGAGYVAARAGRLWRDGHEWPAILGRRAPSREVGVEVFVSGEDFGRFGSLVRESVSDRAVILRVFASFTHQEQRRLPELQSTVEGLVHRVKHLAMKVIDLEARIAEASHRDGGARADVVLADTEPRGGARVAELNGPRDEAAQELRACVAALEELRDLLLDQERHGRDPRTDDLERRLAEAAARLERAR